jgi:hypothetical protein
MSESNKKPETVNVPLDEFKMLMKQVHDLAAWKKAQETPSIVPDKVEESTVTILLVEEKAVVDFVNKGTATTPFSIYEGPDPRDPKQRVPYVDLVLDDASIVKGVNYNEFLREAERVDCLIVKSDKKPWQKVAGDTTRKKVNYEKYNTTDTGIDVPLVVKGFKQLLTVRLPDGREIELMEDYVNIVK